MTMSAEDHDLPGARLLSARAHGLRNQLATVRSVVRLVDDEEVARALDEASRELQVALERAIVLSRVELRERPELVSMELGELLELAERRARREGTLLELATRGDAADVPVAVPGPWAERLVADLLHHAAGDATMTTDAHDATLELAQRERVAEPLDIALERLAAACGGTLTWNDGVVRLQLPRARSVIAE